MSVSGGKMIDRELRWDITKVFVARTLVMSLNFATPILYLLWKGRGFDVASIALLSSCMALAMALFEIPSGLIADRWGRKHAMVISALFLVCGTALIAQGWHFAMFVIGEMCLGVGFSLATGSDISYLYDALLRRSKEALFPRIYGALRIIDIATNIVGSLVCASVVARYSLLAPVYIAGAGFVGYFLVALTMKERRNGSLTPQQVRLDVWEVARSAIRNMTNSSIVRWLVVFNASTTSFFLLAEFLMYPHLEFLKLSAEQFGYYSAVLSVAAGLSALFAHKLYGLVKPTYVMIGSSLFAAVCVCICGAIPATATLLVFPLISAAKGLSWVTNMSVINGRLESSNRTTIVSCDMFISRMIIFASQASLGGYVDSHSSNQAFILLGGIALVMFTSQIWISALYREAN